MTWLRQLWMRLQTLFRRNRFTEQLTDEIRFHVDEQIAEKETRLQAIQVRQEALFGEVLVRRHSEFDNVLGEQGAVKDDWR